MTASTGAAIRDIMNISARRNPYVQLISVSGSGPGRAGAKYSIVKGIQTLDRMNLDVIIVGRGGGSIEDLWAFNEEMVARAIFECGTPVISAVGHETDVTIADYVADMRAPTPSAAAELAVFDYSQFEAQTDLYRQNLKPGHGAQAGAGALPPEPGRAAPENAPTRSGSSTRNASAWPTWRTAWGGSWSGGSPPDATGWRCWRGVSSRLSPLEQISRGYGFITDGGGKTPGVRFPGKARGPDHCPGAGRKSRRPRGGDGILR